MPSVLALVNDIKLLSSPVALPPYASRKGNPPFPPWLLAFFLLKLLLIQCLGNESFPSSKRTRSFANDQGGNKKQRQDDDDDNYNNPGDYGDNGRNHDDNDDKPKGKDFAKGKEKQNGASYCCIFHRLDPVKWLTCGHLRLTTFAYFLQHLKRQHLLNKPYYCENCRIDWDPKGPDSESRWIEHGRAKACRKATVEETGKLLPEEYENIKNKSKSAHDDQDRWFETWKMFFDHYGAPGSPFLKNVAEETEASNLRRLTRALKERLSTLPPGEQRDQMETFTRGVLADAFPAYPMQSSANDHSPDTYGPDSGTHNHTHSGLHYRHSGPGPGPTSPNGAEYLQPRVPPAKWVSRIPQTSEESQVDRHSALSTS
ncbi:hypothetical protein N0V84_002413 [Fusarium piperis]|uniref:Uncharacterized protein n=1 Tax=Fusarium piperis TaxID=1435070 RepID=A0A9W9BRP8_9HYPO|nr:hypothetical protein N0V84_002413 [Fusarium piperis]